MNTLSRTALDLHIERRVDSPRPILIIDFFGGLPELEIGLRVVVFETIKHNGGVAHGKSTPRLSKTRRIPSAPHLPLLSRRHN